MLERIYDRLKNSGQFGDVLVVESIEAISSSAVTAAEDGSLFLTPWRERAKAPPYATGGHRQTVDFQFVTALVLRRHDDPRGDARARQFDASKALVEVLLAGWSPELSGFPVFLIGAEGTGLGNGVSIYAQTWQVSRFLTGAPT
ncbi:phage tail terminator protein [Tabrizicola fusiformis]|uniref:phage tail terminator protein n=1 Tax=Tabrizicola sp. SY72 TaxID=2741673 RepID=UPI00157239A6|nr:hypothetical protein [Tabrizicola sp. SY72]NTT88266.1 hypothetical protein [Tabrizicola sp. SY72]